MSSVASAAMPKARTVAKLLGIATAAAAGVLAVKEAKRRLDARASYRGNPISSSSRNARSAAVAGISARAGGQYALHRARKVFASVERQKELDEQFELQTAESIAAALGNMKGALMKLGQMASYLDQGMPEPVREALAELQANAPPMSAELAAQVVREELGAPPEQVFDTWDPSPIAAASIGQVHRAITKDGRAVAVKVQYPGVADAIRADLDNAGLLFGAMGLMLPGLEPGPLVEELRTRLVEELDYVTEADNQRLFADYYAGHPFIHIPAVVDELCTKRVLTTELAEGARFDEIEDWGQEERDLAAEAIFRFVFGSLYRLHAFNGDPHPGNYLFRPGGHVTFLDFGLVKRFDPDEVGVIASMLKAMVVDNDIKEYRRLIESIGMLKDGGAFTDEEVLDYFGHFYDFVLRDEVGTITPEYASETVRRFFDYGGEHAEILRAANVPPTFVIIQRINLGLYAIFGQLRATANWRRVSEEIWPFVDAPPSTEMGRRAAAWAAERGHA
jgi:predicted unusual protein kinase regulating ubiquinone biosynthesis (AarF/ABC1/UbiB family)